MTNQRWHWWVPGILLLGTGMFEGGLALAQDPPALEGPAASADLEPQTPAPPRPMFEGPAHEVTREWGTEEPRIVGVPKSPPVPIAERPTNDRPSVAARWIPGYWTWDAPRKDFTWVTGTWRVAPRGMIWVNGRWQRDEQGWTRVPGFWSARQTQVATASARAEWRLTGPPADHPDDEPGKAPDPSAFFVPGHYRPDGDRLTWVAGFWSRAQAGWDWVPSRWVRRPDTWEYREGYWTRDRDIARHDVARPRDDEALPPAIVESEPGLNANNSGDRLPPPDARDPLDDEDTTARVVDPLVGSPRVGPYPGVVVGPPSGYYYYRRAPGPYYDPLNVTPPFVRRLLDRVMP